MRKNLSLILLVLFTSCQVIENNPSDEIKSMNDPDVSIAVLIDSIENHGSLEALELLETASLDYRAGEFLSTFMIMADKYNNADASMDVYYQLIKMYHVPIIAESENGIYALDSLNADTKKMVIHYLSKSAKLGHVEAGKHLKEYRKKGMIK